MKTLRVKSQETGLPMKGWKFCHTWFSGQRGKEWGWLLVAPDGYRRFNPGNWQQFVPFVQLVIQNHGGECNIS